MIIAGYNVGLNMKFFIVGKIKVAKQFNNQVKRF